MKRVLLILVLVSLASCSEKLIEPPENLIPQDKMAQIINDMAILNSAFTHNAAKLAKYEKQTMEIVYEKHGIDSAQFVNSDRYYASVPIEYETIYTRAKVMLEKEHTRLKDIKKLTDSLAQVKRDSLISAKKWDEKIKKDSL